MVYYNNPDERARQDELDQARGYSYLKMETPDWQQSPNNPDWAANNPYASQVTPYANTPAPLPPSVIAYLQQQGYTPAEINDMKMHNLVDPASAQSSPPPQTRRSSPPATKSPDAGDLVTGINRMATGAALDKGSLGTYGPAMKVAGAISPEIPKTVNKIVDAGAYVNPLTAPFKIADKLGGGLWDSGKSKDQQRRDQVRKVMQQHGMFGTSGDDWTLDNPDNTGFDVGKDGGAQYNGHKYYETDVTNAPTNQAAAKAGVDPLAYLITGGDKELAPEFSGYFTNTVVQGAGAKDLNILKANILDKYKKAGFDTPEKAQAGIAELVKAGKIDQATGQTLSASVMAAFAPAAPMGGPRRSGPVNPNASNNNMARRRAAGENKKRRTQAQSYTPQTYAPNVLSPTSTSNGYDQFGQGLANVYQQNQEGLV